MEVQDNKKDQIIEAAIKRFSHFGISKTTMNEIADDLAISKALLYYYFPDKISLIVEVVKLIFTEFIKENTQKLANAKNIKDGLYGLIDIRTVLGQKYYMMHVGDGQSEINLDDPRISHLMNPFKAEERKLISEFLAAGVKSKELKDIDCGTIAELLIDIITGVWICELHVKCKVLIPTQEQFDLINKKNKQIIDLCYEGIKNNSYKNDICNLFSKKSSK